MKTTQKHITFLFILIPVFIIIGCTGNIKNGTYIGSGSGYGGALQVEVSFDGGRISDLELKENNETEEIAERAFPVIRKRILDANNPETDCVSGATFTSFAVKTAVADALVKAGGKKIAVSRKTGMENLDIKALKKGGDLKTKLLIVGAGGSGLTAAIAAKREGLDDILVIEKMDILGGNAKFDDNFFDLPNSEAMKKNGVVISKDEFKETLIDHGAHESEERINRWIEEGWGLDAWLRNLGIKLDYNWNWEGVDGPMSHMPSRDAFAGNYIMTRMEAQVKNAGIMTLTGTKMVDLIYSDMDEVKGIKVIDRNTKYNIYADVVLVATGGFSANPEKLKKYTPGVEDIGHSNQIGAQGDFVDIALNHGIAFGHMDSLVVYPTLLIPRRDLTGGSNRPSILVNDQGKRFMDENIGLLEDYEDGLARVNILKEKTGGQSYFVFDQSYREDAAMPEIQIKLGYFTEGATARELAEKLGFNPDVFLAEIETFNKAVEAGKGDPFLAEIGTEKLNPNDRMYATKVFTGVHMTMGGVVVDEIGRVIDNKGNIVPNLFAAGEVTDQSGFFVCSVIFGKVAGQEAAKCVMGNK